MRILLTGATGLVGQGVLHECLRDSAITQVIALGRHASGLAHDKLEELIVADFADLYAVENRLRSVDACLYCAGALLFGASADEYRHVTLTLTTHVAQTLARLNPHLVFLYVSGAYSDPKSAVLPLRVKGETEHALAALPIRTVMLRPGAIQPVDGVHSPHTAMDLAYSLVGPLLGMGVRLAPGFMTTTQRLGRAMLQLLRMENPPSIVENAEINRLGQLELDTAS